MVPETCSVDGCDGTRLARGYCNRHYRRFMKWGDPNMGASVHRHLGADERFWLKADRRGPDDCWEWSAFRDDDGYGRFTDDAGRLGRRTTIRAHRWIYERLVSPVPTGYVVDHLCRNRGCVNPSHLEAVTNQENLDRGWGRRLQNGMVSSCTNGHEYTSDNTYITPKGRQTCRACAAASRARYKQRKKAA